MLACWHLNKDLPISHKVSLVNGHSLEESVIIETSSSFLSSFVFLFFLFLYFFCLCLFFFFFLSSFSAFFSLLYLDVGLNHVIFPLCIPAVSRAMISEVSAHAEASMMLLADLYKAVEKGNLFHYSDQFFFFKSGKENCVS